MASSSASGGGKQPYKTTPKIVSKYDTNISPNRKSCHEILTTDLLSSNWTSGAALLNFTTTEYLQKLGLSPLIMEFGSSTGGGSQPPKKRVKPDDSNNSSISNAHPRPDPLHCDEPGSVSAIKRVQTDHLKCTACVEYPRKEVYQCCNGHLVCDSCIAKITIKRCPVCRKNYSNEKIRSLVAETDLEDMTYNCSYRNHGCPVTKIPRNRRNAHDIQCVHNPTPASLRINLMFRPSSTCTLRICPDSMMQDPQHVKDVIEHLTGDLHKLPQQKVQVGEKSSIRFRLPTTSSKEPNFLPMKLFEVCEGAKNKTLGYYLLVRRNSISMLQQKMLSWAVVELSSAPKDQNGGKPNSGKITVNISINAKADPDKVAKDGDGSVPNQSWKVKSTGLKDWMKFMEMPDDLRPSCSFALPLSFISEYYAQQGNMCEMSVSFFR